MSRNSENRIYPKNASEWSEWLKENHENLESVWVVMYKKKAPNPSMTWSEAVDEALCYGWIDSVKKSQDEFSYLHYYSKRKAKSTWSRINKDKVEVLIGSGKMRDAGMKCIDIAKKNGSWSILDSVDALIVPEDLKLAFDQHPKSEDYYGSLSKSDRKILLYWVISAKRPETRQKRVLEIAKNASQNEKPKQFR